MLCMSKLRDVQEARVPLAGRQAGKELMVKAWQCLSESLGLKRLETLA